MNSSIHKGLQRIEDIFGADFSNREIAKIINKFENTIIFKGKGEPDMYAKVLEWTDKTLLIQVTNSKNNDPNCAIDGKWFSNF